MFYTTNCNGWCRISSCCTFQVAEPDAKYRSIDELKKNLAELDLHIQTDGEVLTSLLEKYKNPDIDTEHRVSLLTDMEFYVHQVRERGVVHSAVSVFFCISVIAAYKHYLLFMTLLCLGICKVLLPFVMVKYKEKSHCLLVT